MKLLSCCRRMDAVGLVRVSVVCLPTLPLGSVMPMVLILMVMMMMPVRMMMDLRPHEESRLSKVRVQPLESRRWIRRRAGGCCVVLRCR